MPPASCVNNRRPQRQDCGHHLRRNKLYGIGFRRQHAIGHYIVDFCSPGKKLVIELDGSQHLAQEELDATQDEIPASGRAITYSVFGMIK